VCNLTRLTELASNGQGIVKDRGATGERSLIPSD
jgi:hypothetical protein